MWILGACVPSPKTPPTPRADLGGLPAVADAPMLLRGVTLTSRAHQQVTLTATIDTAWGDAKRLHMEGLVVRSPDGAVTRADQADWDTDAHTLRSGSPVVFEHPSGLLRAPGATFDTRAGEIQLAGPVTGEGTVPPGP